jgi:hypothetical protein
VWLCGERILLCGYCVVLRKWNFILFGDCVVVWRGNFIVFGNFVGLMR